MTKQFAAVCAAAILMVCGASVKTSAQTSDARETSATTSVPRLVQFNGTLKDTAARPVSGVASVTFAIYADQDGGSALWTETQNVLADSNGHFNALLGTATTGGFPSEFFSTGQSRWLGITIARQPEMPRVMLASVPYAMKAGDADTLGGLPASSYVTAQQLAARTAVAAPSTTIVSSPFAATSAGTNSTPSADASQVLSGNSGPQAAVTGTGTANYLPLWTSGSNLGVSKIYQANGGFVGINTNTPLLQLDVNGNSIFRGSFQMAPQGTATASAGQPSHSFQWQGSVYNSSTKSAVNEAFGFRTVPATNNTSAPTTKLDLFYGPGGGTLNDTGLSISNSGVVTFVPGQQFNGASESVNEINLPNTSGASTGVINFGGQAFITNGGDSSNAFVGGGAGNSLVSTGGLNAAFGGSALGANTTGSANTAVGNSALVANKIGSYSTALGAGAMQAMVEGSENTAVGALAQIGLTTGSFDTSVGVYAGRNNSTGSYNTFLGVEADATVGNLSNATAIGFLANAGESNALILGATGPNAVSVGIGTGTPSHTLEVVDRGVGGAAVFATSTIAGDSAVYGVSNSTSSTAGTNGGLFQSSSPAGAGVVGINNSAGYAGYFEAMGGGFAGYFMGDVTVTGTLTKGGGSFKIDDPIDPAAKYLSHSFVESPDMMNIYNGTVTLDAHGRATVTMPDWFSALNRDFQYQLTAIGAPGPKLYVASEMHGNQFAIAGGKKGMRVSWMVTGIRQDAWANAHRIPTEEAKPANEQGRYLHPELYGAGPDKSVAAMPTPSPAVAQTNDVNTGTDNATGRK
jgi:hypothetical protein